ncbi:hypothetical protein [Sphingobacterium anhuiense]|uniref:Uncharacterized protein n=1 Tax=Sphingobacterium anhuiense TaxID=493780 RepID=A0ABW5YWK9_9SPHI
MIAHVFENLSDQRMNNILQKMYSEVPRVMKMLAPEGWKKSNYHKQIQEQQQHAYHEYIADTLAGKLQSSCINKKLMDEVTFLNKYALNHEEYHSFKYPGIDQDEQEVFFIFLLLLLDISEEGDLLYQQTNQSDIIHYYLAYVDVEKIALEIAGEQGHILKDDIEYFLFSDFTIDWDEMERFNCLRLIFKILQTEKYIWHHIDSELQHIAICYHEDYYLAYSALPYYEKSLQQNEIIKTIQQYVSKYKESWLDPYDFEAIIALYNRHKINYSVLAYVHCYQAFPVGYPYQVYHYLDGYSKE